MKNCDNSLQARPSTTVARKLQLSRAERRHAVLQPYGTAQLLHPPAVEVLSMSTTEARLQLSKLIEIRHGSKAATPTKEVDNDPTLDIRKHAHNTSTSAVSLVQSGTHSLMCRLHSPCSPSLQQSPARQTSLPQKRHRAG